MKLALAGYGRMGRLVEALATGAGDEIVLRLTSSNNRDAAAITREAFAGVDAAIDFSTPNAVIANMGAYVACGVSAVIGTTGWFGELEAVRAMVNTSDTAVVWGSNFSIGVHLFARIVSEAARLFADQANYEAWAWEMHHSAKKDAPSGTLLRLVEEMRASGYTFSVNQSSSRAGSVPGTHEIGWDSAEDTVTLRHTARNREGFARGALLAAHWLPGQRGLHEFGELISK